MKSSILLPLFLGANAGFFEGSTFDEFKQRIEDANQGFLEANGQLRNDVFDSWSDSELRKWLDYHKIDAAAAENTNALVAKANEHKDKLFTDLKDLIDNPPPSEKILTKGAEYFDAGKKSVYDAWSDSALRAYLAARGQEVQDAFSHDNLVRLAEDTKATAADTKDRVSRAWFDSWTYNELKSALEELGESAEGTRQKLADSLYSNYVTLKQSAAEGQAEGKKNAEKTLKSLEQWRKDTFDQWSVEDLTEYVSQFGPSAPSKKDQLVAAARKNWNYFIYGETHPKTLGAQVQYYAHLAAVHVSAGFGFLKGKVFNKDEL